MSVDLDSTIRNYFRQLSQQVYFAETQEAYQRFEVDFLRRVISLLMAEVAQREEFLKSLGVLRAPSVQIPASQEPEQAPDTQETEQMGSETEPAEKVFLTPEEEQQALQSEEPQAETAEAPKPQQSRQLTKEEVESLTQELNQLASDYDARKSTLAPSIQKMYEDRIEEIKKLLQSQPPSTPSPPTTPSTSAEAKPAKKLGFLEGRKLRNLQFDLQRVKQAYEKRRLEPDFTPELDEKYHKRMNELQSQIDRILGG
jgi:hypothetical protein